MIGRTLNHLVALLAIAGMTSACAQGSECENCTSNGGPTEDASPDQQGTGGAGGAGGSGNIDLDQWSPPADAGPECDADTMTSATNCGACGHVCNIPGAFPTCVDGQCHIDSCAADNYDLDGDESNGCEYACSQSNGGVEICDNRDNDCDGEIDEDFDLNTDVDNCGVCGLACSADNATSSCDKGQCTYTCNAGFSDLGNPSAGGCFYACPVNPAIAEVCNGIDDDCNGTVDDNNPGGGAPCEDNCPNGRCLGTCQPGTTLCTGTTAGLQCVGGVGEAPETCDGKDNDCDGQTDEDFDLQTDPLNCGSCGVKCKAGDACIGGQCQFTCQDDFRDIDQDPANGCEYHCPVYPTTAEVCNGKDDDCNGVADDNPTDADLGQSCDTSCPAANPCVAAGTCSYPTSQCTGRCCGACTAGTLTCTSGQKLCAPGAGPSAESCDGADNNCDGQIDEGFDLTSDPLNCGGCGNACNLANAVAACNSGTCAIAACRLGFADIDKDPRNGCEYGCPVDPPIVESCNGLDDDCDGAADEDLQNPPNFCTQTGICAGAVPTCGGSLGWTCNYQSVNPGIEVDANGNLAAAETVCDGIDGNCNGQIDESFFNLGDPCTSGTGLCEGTSTFQCKPDGTGTYCPAAADNTKAIDELCNGIDDNCDGQIDERTPNGSLTCYNGSAHPCQGWIDPMVRVGSSYMFKYEASRPGATSSDEGTATNRACSAYDVLPWANVSKTEADAACAAVLDSLGNPMRLCTQAEWQTACTTGSSADPIWAFSSNATTYNPSTCNGYDQGLLQAWSTASGMSCYANTASGRIYDLSGNLAEWTATNPAGLPANYFSVMGGGYGSLQTAISCNFDFVVAQSAYVNYDLGFRCCSNAAP